MTKSIIFLHGFPYDKRMWKNQTEFFSNLYNCYTLDLPGSGEKGKERIFSLEDMADSVIEYIQINKIDSPTLVGLSMGGYVALRVIEKSDSIASKLILLDTKSEADHDEAKIKRAIGIKKLKENDPYLFLKDFVKNCIYPENWNTNSEIENYLLNEITLSQDPLGLASQLLAMAGRTETLKKEIKIPTLLLCGEFDTLTTPETMKKMMAQIPNSKIDIVPKSAHISAIENSEFVNIRILEFLKTPENYNG